MIKTLQKQPGYVKIMRQLSAWVRPARPNVKSGAKRHPAKKRPRDFQRSKVYLWENSHIHQHGHKPSLTLEACRALVREVFIWYESPANSRDWQPPSVTDGRGRRHACGSRQVIKLPRWSRHQTIVLHECAHGMAEDGHGPIFMRRYIDLLETFAGFDASTLEDSAIKAGIRIEPRPGTS